MGSKSKNSSPQVKSAAEKSRRGNKNMLVGNTEVTETQLEELEMVPSGAGRWYGG